VIMIYRSHHRLSQRGVALITAMLVVALATAAGVAIATTSMWISGAPIIY